MFQLLIICFTGYAVAALLLMLAPARKAKARFHLIVGANILVLLQGGLNLLITYYVGGMAALGNSSSRGFGTVVIMVILSIMGSIGGSIAANAAAKKREEGFTRWKE